MSLGEALSTARRALGATQKQVSSEAGITQAALSRLENDLRKPDTRTLEAIAKALGLTPRLLHNAGRMQGAVALDVHMRRRATAAPTVWRRLEARCNLYRLHSRNVLEHVAVRSELTIPQLDPFDTPPDAAARIMRMQWRMPGGPVRNLVVWMEAAGCLIFDEPFGTSRVDGMSQWADGHPVILLNAEPPTDRRRLTLAHELGHLCLHSHDITDDIETEATEFAAEFLMPAAVIRPTLRNLTVGKLHDLKRYWGVSMQALIERAYRLGCLSKPQRTQLYKRFSALGWRKREPLSDELAPEKPRLAAEIGESFLKAGLTEEEVATIVGLDRAAAGLNPFLPPDDRPALRIV